MAARLSGSTAWGRGLDTPLRRFLRTETGSAAILLAATVGAVVWVNVDPGSYESFWHTSLSINLGGSGISQDLRGWVNSGLMTLFFFVIGLETRREFDMGELRDRRRVALPLAAGLGGVVAPVAIFLAVNAGRPSAHGWAVAMSTDTAFALGVLALVGRRFPPRLRTYVLTFSVVDDVVALIVIAVAYTSGLTVLPLLAGVALVGLIAVAVLAGLRRARSARVGVASALSPNERLQQSLHPWTSYAIVPLFALANAGIPLDGGFLGHAFRSPITLGIVAACLLGKPLGVAGASALVTTLTRGRLRPPVGWAAVAGGGFIAGITFTVSLLIASLAFEGDQLREARLGILTAAAGAALATPLVYRATALLRPARRIRALLGTAEAIIDLDAPVDPERDHLRGPEYASVTLVEYGDFECPYCGLAEPVVRALLQDFGDLRYVWRHLPLTDVHPHAQLAAEASEAAAEQGAFWGLHDLLLEHQGALRFGDLTAYAEQLGLDVTRFTEDLARHAGAGHVAEDVESADLSGVSGTPTFFVNGRRHHGAYDIDTLSAAVRAARARASIANRD